MKHLQHCYMTKMVRMLPMFFMPDVTADCESLLKSIREDAAAGVAVLAGRFGARQMATFEVMALQVVYLEAEAVLPVLDNVDSLRFLS